MSGFKVQKPLLEREPLKAPPSEPFMPLFTVSEHAKEEERPGTLVILTSDNQLLKIMGANIFCEVRSWGGSFRESQKQPPYFS